MYRKNAWKKYSEDLSPVMNYAEGYKKFISFGKTERLVARESEELLRKAGFKSIEEVSSLKEGDRVYFINKNKNVCASTNGFLPIMKAQTFLFLLIK